MGSSLRNVSEEVSQNTKERWAPTSKCLARWDDKTLDGGVHEKQMDVLDSGIKQTKLLGSVKQGCHNWSFCKSSGCNCYGFLHLNCHAFRFNKLSSKNYKF